MTAVAWTRGNSLELLENGEAFFPAVFDAIRKAQRSVVLETFILFEDAVGTQLQQVAIEAARRGVRVDITVDGYGSADLTEEFIGAMTSACVRPAAPAPGHAHQPVPALASEDCCHR
jgi:cardiolipin synthase